MTRVTAKAPAPGDVRGAGKGSISRMASLPPANAAQINMITLRKKLVEELVVSGITPLEVLLVEMRDAWNAIGPDGKPDRNERNRAVAIAKEAAPYVHPKLSSVDAKVDVTNHEAALALLE